MYALTYIGDVGNVLGQKFWDIMKSIRDSPANIKRRAGIYQEMESD